MGGSEEVMSIFIYFIGLNKETLKQVLCKDKIKKKSVYHVNELANI